MLHSACIASRVPVYLSTLGHHLHVLIHPRMKSACIVLQTAIMMYFDVLQVSNGSNDSCYLIVIITNSFISIPYRVLFRWMTAKSMYAIEFAGAPPGTPEELIMGFKDGKSTYCRIFELLCL